MFQTVHETIKFEFSFFLFIFRDADSRLPADEVGPTSPAQEVGLTSPSQDVVQIVDESTGLLKSAGKFNYTS